MKRRSFLHGVAGVVGSFGVTGWSPRGGKPDTGQSPLPARAGHPARPRQAWDAALRDYVRELQERHYRKLAEQLGLVGDPAATYARFSNPGMPAASSKFYITIDKLWRDGVTQVPLELPAKFEGEVAAVFDTYAAVDAPTPYENATSYRSMSMTFDPLEKALLDRGLLSEPRPVLATRASGNVNALIEEEPEHRRPIIFFEHGLFRFLSDFALLTAWIAPTFSFEEMGDDLAIARKPARHTMSFEASQGLFKTLRSYVVDGNVTNLPIPMPPHNMPLALVLSGQMQRFVMAHELAHLTLGHLRHDKAPKEDELAADVAAMALVSAKDVGGRSWAFNVWACDITLTCLHFLDLALGYVKYGARPKWASATHPDAPTRRQNLRRLAERCPENASDVGCAALGVLYRMNDALFQRLAEMLLPLLLAERTLNKAQPSALWRERIESVFSSPT